MVSAPKVHRDAGTDDECRGLLLSPASAHDFPLVLAGSTG
jgi:hypothetical protein